MCGIAGVVDFRDFNAQLPTDRVERMLEILHHRGPDDRSVHDGGKAILGHNRLALLDRAGGAQPMADPSGRFCIVFDGEIVNFDELRAMLADDWSFKTSSDTEVLLAAFVSWGTDCLQRLNGMFSFFVWDRLEQRGFAARDRLGIKPFLYSKEADHFVFASEAKAIVGSQTSSPRLNDFAVMEYLCAPMFSGVETSIFKGVEILAPGSLLEIDRSGLHQRIWYDYELEPLGGRDDRCAELAAALPGAVERAMVADEPVCTYMSGGLDSTLIAAIAARHNPELTSFTARFDGHDRYDYTRSRIVISDDTAPAAQAAREIGVSQTVVDIDGSVFCDDLDALVRANDALPAWEQEVTQRHLARAASARGFRATLVGDAADETHYGYHFLLDEHATAAPEHLVRRFSQVPVREGFWQDPIGTLDAHYRSLVSEAGHQWKTREQCTLATTYLIVRRWLPRLLHNGDIHSMAFSLESRVPFGDNELLDIARRVPPHLGYRDGTEKWLLRRAAYGLMPEPQRRRRKSAMPKDQSAGERYQRLLRAELETVRELLGHYLITSEIETLCSPHRVLHENERALLFRVLALGRFASTYDASPE